MPPCVSAQLPGGAQITIESLTTGGAAADNGSLSPSISSDGRFVAAQFERLWTLTVDAVTVNGAVGRVTSTPAGIDCATDSFDAPAMATDVCTAQYVNATVVKLRATPQAGSAFAGWAGACTHKRPVCTVPMKAAGAATATFTKPAGVTSP